VSNTVDVSTREVGGGKATSRAMRLEVGAVVFLLCAPALASLGSRLIWGSAYPEQAGYRTAAAFETMVFERTLISLRYVPLILFVIWRSGEGWSRFGIVKIELGKDVWIGLGLWIVVAALDGLIGLAFHRHYPWSRLLAVSVSPERALLLVVHTCAVGFSEELTCRAYLISRLEAITGAAWKGVALSAVLFGFVHVSNGYVSAIGSLVVGLVWGVGFCLTRRIWPVALSHAILDFIVYTHLGALVGM